MIRAAAPLALAVALAAPSGARGAETAAIGPAIEVATPASRVPFAIVGIEPLGVSWSLEGPGALSRLEPGAYVAPARVAADTVIVVTARVEADTGAFVLEHRFRLLAGDGRDTLACDTTWAPTEGFPMAELPEPIYRPPAPVWPFEGAAPPREQREVLVQALVCASGHVVEARVVKSAPGLDALAIAHVLEWLLEPGRMGDRPMSVWVAIPIRFDARED